ncbi:MAG: 6-pyruvoyl-tetrahydropterin synthase-related protein [bacterium]|nr:6-pyruvoyl-tetrahydropterin synthase-related protein [bacterium]
MNSWKKYLLILLLSSFPLVHMFLTPDLPHTSDGAMHTIRFASYYKELVAGQFPVRWASQFDYGYGTPIFNFFAPLPYMLGVPFIVFGVPLVMVLKLNFALSYLLAGICMYLFAKSYFKDEKVAIFVTLMYQYAPFRLVDMLVRGSLGSLYSYTMLPLLFYAITKFIEKKTYAYFVLIALATGLLSMSHNIVGFVFFGISVLYIPFATRKIREIVSVYLAMGLGLTLAGFFLIPAILEHKYVNGYLFTKDLFYDHFPPLYKLILPNITNDVSLRVAEVSVQIGIFHLIAFGILFFLFVRRRLTGSSKHPVLYLLLISFLTFLFIEPITKPLWENISVIRQFQYPWRLLSIICFTSAFASAFVIIKYPILQKKTVYFVLSGLVIFSTVVYWAPYQGYQKVSQEAFWNYPKSTNYFAEVNTIWMADEPRAFPKNRIEIIAGDASVSDIKIAQTTHSFLVNAREPSTVLDRTYFFPGWRVLVDSAEVPMQFQDQNYRGLITFAVPQGNHKVTVFKGENKLEIISDGISIATGIVLIGGWFFFQKKQKIV